MNHMTDLVCVCVFNTLEIRVFFKIRSHFIVQAGLVYKLTILRPQPSESWDYKCMPPCPVRYTLFKHYLLTLCYLAPECLFRPDLGPVFQASVLAGHLHVEVKPSVCKTQLKQLLLLQPLYIFFLWLLHCSLPSEFYYYLFSQPNEKPRSYQ